MPALSAKSVGVRVAIAPILQTAKSKSKQKLCSLREEIPVSILHHASMRQDKNAGPNYLRVWREKERITQEELAARLDPPTTGAVISLLEEGERGLSAKWLRRLAPALKTTPGHLLEYHPSEVEDVVEIWTHIPDRDKPTARRVLESFRTGTDN